eukprot:TRINITY_DN7188_c0_g1_i4.p1 TRINITY_DN7188_c0_g1~~TRINITY_DN7188_c0_g1_i4.p1  ORF type:complete len:388 (+),score=81.72 TRINITY_DN7188_c0_g1_i4:1049-2212(+)
MSASVDPQYGSYCSAPWNTMIANLTGTSMATPLLAGHAILIRQYFTDGFYPLGVQEEAFAFNPSASLLKAMLINGGVEMLGFKASGDNFCTMDSQRLEKRPNYVQGFGRTQLDQILCIQDVVNNSFLFIPSFESANEEAFFDRSISYEEEHQYAFCAFPGNREIRITLVWTDYPSDENAAFNLVNDLDLKVNYNGTEIYGNTQSSLLQESADFVKQAKNVEMKSDTDSLNPVESVYLNPPVQGMTTILVSVLGEIVPFGPQFYSLVLTGSLAEGICKPNMSMARPKQLQGKLYNDTDLITPAPPAIPAAKSYVVPILSFSLILVASFGLGCFFWNKERKQLSLSKLSLTAVRPPSAIVQELPELSMTATVDHVGPSFEDNAFGVTNH